MANKLTRAIKKVTSFAFDTSISILEFGFKIIKKMFKRIGTIFKA